MNNKTKILIKNLLFSLLIFAVIAGLFSLYADTYKKPENVAISDLVNDIKAGHVQTIKVKGNDLTVIFDDDTKKVAFKESETSLVETLSLYNVTKEDLSKINIQIESAQSGSLFWIGVILPFILPFLIIFFIFWFIFRKTQQGQVQALSFGRSKAKLFSPQKGKVTFKDVAGLKEAKEEVIEMVEFLRNAKKFLDLGARIPRGVLMFGPPGTGKTLLARAVAGEADVPFFYITGSEFVEMFVGVGASRVRDLFDTAKKNAPSIIFIDEIDAVGRQRGTGLGGGHDEREQTLNQILSEMDGFERDTNIIVIAATNRPDVLDPALLRPGRFDRQIVLDEPDIKDREEILKIHAKDKPFQSNVNLREIAERTPGFSGADLANVVNEAAILTARHDKKIISQKELKDSIEKVMLGPERRSHLLSKKEKEIAAYHEAGHALVAASMPLTDPVHKISIISRGRAAGYTLKLPEEEKHFRSKTEFTSELAVMMGGYAAEKIVFDELTTGASNDLRNATDLARKLVMAYGMSEELGPIVFSPKEEMVFLGREISEHRHYSEEIASKIDSEVSKFLKSAYQNAMRVIKQKRLKLNEISNRLIEKEAIERREFEELMGIKPVAV